MSTTPAKSSHPRLEHALERHWQSDDALISVSELPDTARDSLVSSFAHAVVNRAPNWVLLPVPPLTRDRANRYLAALRRKGLQAALRPSTAGSRRLSVWARQPMDAVDDE